MQIKSCQLNRINLFVSAPIISLRFNNHSFMLVRIIAVAPASLFIDALYALVSFVDALLAPVLFVAAKRLIIN